MDKLELSHQQELSKCHKQLVDSFAKFAAGEYQLSFQQSVHKLIQIEEEHEKKKKKWKAFYHLQKQLEKKKNKFKMLKVSLFDKPMPYDLFAPACPPEELLHYLKKEEEEDDEDW